MNENDDHAIAKAWVDLQYAVAGSPEYEELFWAHTFLDELIDSDVERSWNIINKIRMVDDSDFLLSNLAAGPMEDILSRSGEEVIDKVESIARVDQGFRRLLAGLWRGGISSAIWERVQSAAST